ncbi:MAG: hypothetical protein B7Z44_06330 [Caulobacter sp. 12-67-6]|nr:MAG: hypothetical protein B7Z44_06330 [Caulobacter sp. 12-67-6]
MIPAPPQLSRLYENTPVLVAAYDADDRLRYANAAFRAAFFLQPRETPLWSELMRRNVQAGRGTVLRAATFEDWLVSTQARRGKTGFRAFETDLVDGRWLWMTETVDADGWMLCIASDITTLRADERAVRQDRDIAMKAAHTDDLTGVANRRFITARIEEMLQSPRPSSASGSGHGCVAVIDIDNFKYINDQHGHAVGDAILKDFARRMLTLVRRADCFGRIGGEGLNAFVIGQGRRGLGRRTRGAAARRIEPDTVVALKADQAIAIGQNGQALGVGLVLVL